MKITRQKWEEYEIQFLCEVSETMPLCIIAEKLERKVDSVRKKAKYLGLKTTTMRRFERWSEKDTALFQTHTPAQISRMTGRSYESVTSKLHHLRQKLAA